MSVQLVPSRRKAYKPPTRLKNRFAQERRLGMGLLAPCLILLAVFAVYPVGRTIVMAFGETQGFDLAEGGFQFTLENFRQAVSSNYFWDSVRNTMYFVFFSVLLQTLVGILLALLANKAFKGQGLARAALLLPWAMPPAVAAMAWRWMSHDTYGVFNDLLRRAAITDGTTYWLGEPTLAMWMLIILAVWKVSSFMGLLILAGLQSIPDELYEAASIDGAGGFRAFMRVTLPLLRPTILVAMLLRALQAIQVFDLPYALTDGGPGNATEMMGMFIYRTSFIGQKAGVASAQSLIMLFISMILAMVYFILNAKEAES